MLLNMWLDYIIVLACDVVSAAERRYRGAPEEDKDPHLAQADGGNTGFLLQRIFFQRVVVFTDTG